MRGCRRGRRLNLVLLLPFEHFALVAFVLQITAVLFFARRGSANPSPDLKVGTANGS